MVSVEDDTLVAILKKNMRKLALAASLVIGLIGRAETATAGDVAWMLGQGRNSCASWVLDTY